MKELIPEEVIEHKIFMIRGHRVMLDQDLAKLYKVSTGNLNKAVKRKIKRFPGDFMFQLTSQEVKNLIFQFGIARWGGTRTLPYAFTQPGLAMLSSVLNSDIAIQANIQIMRVFTKMGEWFSKHKDILLKLEQLERKIMRQDARYRKHEQEIHTLFSTIRDLMYDKQESNKPRKRVGYKRKDEE